MATVLLPGCKVKARYPEASEKLREYIERRFDAVTGGCCRVEHKGLKDTDRVINVCNNCGEILDHSAPQTPRVTVWELIDSDEDFDFPNYEGAKMALQDCWIASDQPKTHEAVRSLCRKMNIDFVELEENRENSLFCGSGTLSEPSKSNASLAPQRWLGENAERGIHPTPVEQHEGIFKERCEKIPCDDVICYCKFCNDALDAGGKKAHHLLELLFC